MGKDSWTAFHLLQLDFNFVSLPVVACKMDEGNQHAKRVVSNLPVGNDAAERGLGLATDTNSETCSYALAELQALYRITKDVREK